MSMLQTSLVKTDLGANHFMWTQARFDIATGLLEANTRAATFTLLGGFTGGAEIALLDASDFIVGRTHVQRVGVNGKWLGRSDYTVPWTDQIDTQVAAKTASLLVFQFWAPDWNANLDKWLGIGVKAGDAVVAVIGAVKPSGSGK